MDASMGKGFRVQGFRVQEKRKIFFANSEP
jgi:hypothetical protein